MQLHQLSLRLISKISKQGVYNYSLQKQLLLMRSMSSGQLPKEVLPVEARSKVELHVHLDGSVRPETVWQIARDRDLLLPAKDPEDMKHLLHIPVEHSKTLTEFLAKFDIFLPYICTEDICCEDITQEMYRSGHADSIKRMTHEFCEDLAKDKVIYAEARMAPHLLANSLEQPCYGVPKGDLTPRNVVELVLEALQEGYRRYHVKVNLILACMRHLPQYSQEVLDLCVEFRDKGVGGIDLAGDENLTKTCPTQRKHIEVFQKAKKLDIRRTVHAGENGPAENVREAFEDMCAERIGHGYHTVQDVGLYTRLLEHNVHFEVCPMSSLITGSVPLDSKHPVHKFAEDGANFSINTDDPTVTGMYLLGEYKFVKDVLKLSEKDLLLSNINAARSAFLPDDEKEKLLDVLREDYKDELEYYKLSV